MASPTTTARDDQILRAKSMVVQRQFYASITLNQIAVEKTSDTSAAYPANDTTGPVLLSGMSSPTANIKNVIPKDGENLYVHCVDTLLRPLKIASSSQTDTCVFR